MSDQGPRTENRHRGREEQDDRGRYGWIMSKPTLEKAL